LRRRFLIAPNFRSDVAASVSGLLSTAGIGTVLAGGDNTIGVFGLFATGGVGTLSANSDTSVSLTGVSSTSAIGSATATGSTGFIVTQEYSSVVTGSSSSPTYSFTVTTGTPSPGRKIYAVTPLVSNSFIGFSSATFGGSPMTKVASASSGGLAQVAIWVIEDDSSTSATLEVTLSNSNPHLGESVNVFSVYGAAPSPSFSSSSSTNATTVSFIPPPTSAGDAMLLGYAAQNGSSVTFTSSPSVTITETYDTDADSGDFHASGFISPSNMTSDLTFIGRTTTVAADKLMFAVLTLKPA
jgi:hypothetical protein